MNAYTDGEVIYTSTDATASRESCDKWGCKVWYVNEKGVICHSSDGVIHQFMDCTMVPITIPAWHVIISPMLQALAAAETQRHFHGRTKRRLPHLCLIQFVKGRSIEKVERAHDHHRLCS
jgi:hypothetical protein